jgi:hypothetical protein
MAEVALQKDGKADFLDRPIGLEVDEKAMTIDSLDDAFEDSVRLILKWS